jgi:hypothetical protein
VALPQLEGKKEMKMDYLTSTLVIGAGATLVMDGWGLARSRVLGVPAMDYGLVGRWLAHRPRERFRQQRIAALPPVRGERVVGWTAHYLIGVAFAAVLLALWGIDWARHPTLAPALIVGIGSVAAPFLVMQARVQSLVTHTVFGLGLYAAAWLQSTLWRV